MKSSYKKLIGLLIVVSLIMPIGVTNKYHCELLSNNVEALTNIETFYDETGLIITNSETGSTQYGNRTSKGKGCKYKAGSVCLVTLSDKGEGSKNTFIEILKTFLNSSVIAAVLAAIL